MTENQTDPSAAADEAATAAPCTHEGAQVDAYLGAEGGRSLPWMVPEHLLDDPARVERLRLLATRTGDVALGQCSACGQAVVAVGVRGSETERSVEPRSGGGGLDYGTPSWSTRWTPLTRPADVDNEPRVDVDAATRRVLRALSRNGVDLGADAGLLARAAVLATLTGIDAYDIEQLRRSSGTSGTGS